MHTLEWVSQTGLSTWIREGNSIWAYPMIITFHSAGLAVMVGLSCVVALRILGFASARAAKYSWNVRWMKPYWFPDWR